MSAVLAEVILQRAIIAGVRAARKDPRIVDALFTNLTQEQLNGVRTFLLETPIDFSVNYPKQNELKVPALVLLLKSENESDPFLGDHMGTSPHYDVPDTELSEYLIGGQAATVSDSSGLGRVRLGSLTVESSTESTVTFTADMEDTITEFLLDGGAKHNLNLHVTAGTGAGQVYRVTRMSTISLDIDGTFDTLLDNTSIVALRDADTSELPLGEPSAVYDVSATNLERLGAIYEAQYYLEVIAGHQDEVIYLYSFVKAILFSQRKTLESQGLMALQISGTDFAPRSEYGPSDVFQRAMTLKFKYPFSVIGEIEVFKNFQVNLDVDDPETGELCHKITVTI